MLDRKSFLGTLVALVLAPFVPAQTTKKKPTHAPKAVTPGPLKQCGTCLHFLPTIAPNGSCIRYPKNYAGGDPTQRKDWMFPIMSSTDLCGEFTFPPAPVT